MSRQLVIADADADAESKPCAAVEAAEPPVARVRRAPRGRQFKLFEPRPRNRCGLCHRRGHNRRTCARQA